MKNLISVFLAIFLAGCDDNQEKFQNACAELTSTRVIETSKRMDILKSYGFTPIEATRVETGLGLIQSISSMTDHPELDETQAQLLRAMTASCMSANGLSCSGLLWATNENISEDVFMTSIVQPTLECIQKNLPSSQTRYPEITDEQIKKQELDAQMARENRTLTDSKKYSCTLDPSKLECECFKLEKLDESVILGYSHCKEIAKLQAEENQ